MKEFLAYIIGGLMAALGCVTLLACGLAGLWLIINGHPVWGSAAFVGCLGFCIGTVAYLGDH